MKTKVRCKPTSMAPAHDSTSCRQNHKTALSNFPAVFAEFPVVFFHAILGIKRQAPCLWVLLLGIA